MRRGARLFVVTGALAGIARLARLRADLRAGAAGLSSDEELRVPDDAAELFVPTSDGGTIRVVERGAGQPIVLVHGYLLSSAAWAYQLRDLAESRRVIAIDQRGHGGSKAGRDGYSIARLAEDLSDVIGALGLQDAVVVGHSLGGMVALQMMASGSERPGGQVAGLVLVATSGGPMSPLPGWSSVLSSAVPANEPRLAAPRAAATEPDMVGYASVRLCLGKPAKPAHVELTRSLVRSAIPEGLGLLGGEILGFDVSASLGEIRVPALVMVGTRDRLMPPWHARRLVRRLANAQLRTLKGSGHMMMLERRWELDGAIERFAVQRTETLRAKRGA